MSGNQSKSKPFIISNGKIKGWSVLRENTVHWFKETILSGQTYRYNYFYMQTSYGAPATNHAWSLLPSL